MIFTTHIRLAVVGIYLLMYVVSPAGATTFEFPSCVEGCIASSGCKTNSAKCMCREARELLLDSVISCMYFNCKADLRNFEDSFLKPIEDGCERNDRDIPSSKVKAAESLASSYISKLTPLTTTKSSTTERAPTPTLPTSTPSSSTTSELSLSSKTTEQNTPASTSVTDNGSETRSTSAAEDTTAAPTLVLAPSAAAQPSTSRSPASDSGSGFDTDPFGSSSSAGHVVQPLFSLLGLPLVVGMLALALR
ncbi:uncharacterized protein B0T15DRAFT_488984 [Chaetomium strumarium]|uniref:Extracellular membrane protein CFEM domain-containing protein n=1 Tax=Chaetomium strumarium TaxID=1170767 RepID=A0AAJ0H2H7_9PEZI|nr:hypothetical protein B0T15DRAFT_488984 [Chaetomium strumarium]